MIRVLSKVSVYCSFQDSEMALVCKSGGTCAQLLVVVCFTSCPLLKYLVVATFKVRLHRVVLA